MYLHAILSITIAPSLFSFLTAAASMICYPTPTKLPRFRDCEDLLNAITYVSSLPSESQPRTWGRRLPDTDTTNSLPKLYYFNDERTPGFSTCAVEVDVDPTYFWAVETFTLARVGVAAEHIVDKCLENNRLVGLATLGDGGKVQARVFRTDRPRLDGVGVGLLNGRRGQLWMVEGEVARRLLVGQGLPLKNGTGDYNGTVGETS